MGLLDDVFTDLSEVLVDVFVDNPATVTRAESGGTYDAVTGVTSTGSSVSFEAKVSPPENFEERFIDGDVVRRGDARVMLPATDSVTFAPKAGDEVLLDGVTWSVLDVENLVPGDRAAVHVLHLRKTNK